MKKAFTLIELLVAIGIFSILIAIGVGGFVHALHTQREVAGLITAQDNASVVLEQMAREIRTGYLFCDQIGITPAVPNATCALAGTSGCTISGNVWTCNNILDFYNSDSQDVDYALQNGAIARSDTGAGGTFTPITGNGVNVDYLSFTILGNTEGDNWPPRITIALGVSPSSTDPALAGDILNLQTTVSGREIDCTQGSSPTC